MAAWLVALLALGAWLATTTTGAAGAAASGQQSGEQRFAKEKLEFREPALPPSVQSPPSRRGAVPPPTAVFIHASVGIFKKKKPVGTNETWGYGREIMEEILEHVQSSGLLGLSGTNVYVTLLGTPADRALATGTLRKFNSSGNVHLHLSGTNLYVSELPTIKAIQMYAQRVPPQTRLLYFHTKGMRNMGKFAVDWRRYGQHFLIDRHDLCLRALGLGYATCGVQLNGEEYVGNFFWARADWVARRELDLLAIPWHMGNRYVAEDFLLAPTVLGSNDAQQHYCLLFINHNLYDCPTPHSLYADLPISAPKTRDGNLPTTTQNMPAKDAEGKETSLAHAVTCPPSRQVKSPRVKDNHGGTCISSISLMR